VVGCRCLQMWAIRPTTRRLYPSLHVGVADMEIVPKIVEVSLMGEGKVLVTFSDDQVAIIEPAHIYTLAHNLQVLRSPPIEEDRAI
jgi:hypothetical protein